MLAVVWHWWISVFAMISVVGLVLATIAGYLYMVVRPRYPRKK